MRLRPPRYLAPPFLLPPPPLVLMLQRLRSLARRVFNRVEALLHPTRRKRALARAKARGRAPLVFICLGNICRSPFAEVWMRARDPAGADNFLSAGFMPGGRRSPDTAQEVALAFGVDLAAHVSRGLSGIPPGDHLWVVMEAAHRRRLVRGGTPNSEILVLGDLDPDPVERRAIPDPYGSSPEVFADTYRRIVRCLEVLASARGD